MEKIFTKQYRITHKDTDFNGKATLSALGNFALDLAGLHSIEINTSIAALNEKNLTWVVTGIHFDITTLPTINSIITITTHISEYTHLACKRDFEIENNGNIIAKISTEWIIINCKTRRPVFLTDVLPHITNLITTNNNANKYKHLRFVIDNTKTNYNYLVRYSDIDINQHLYSMRYIELALNLIDVETFCKYHLSSVDINYISEVRYNQMVTLILNQQGNSSLIEMQNQEQKPMFRAELVWQPQE